MTMVLGLVNVVVQRTAHSKPQVFHIDMLKPFLVEVHKSLLVNGTEPTTPSEEEAPSKLCPIRKAAGLPAAIF